jgi:pyruvate kinase
MLSAESASGAYPIEAVMMMNRILRKTEQDPMQRIMMDAVASRRHKDTRDAISAAIRTVAETLPVAATVAYTSSGATALRVAHERPRAPILSMSPIRETARRLSLVWGVHSIQAADVTTTEEMVMHSLETSKRSGFGEPGQALLIVAGTPFGVSGSTNLLRIAWIEDSK